MLNEIGIKRAAMVQKLFPEGFPRLWCPFITHYKDGNEIDKERMEAHLKAISPYVKSFLIPGSTGDGWAIDGKRLEQLLIYAIELITKIDGKMLISDCG